MPAAGTLVDRPRLRGVIHTVATGLAVVAGVALVLHASGFAARAAATGYGISMTVLFGVSAAYHRLRWSPPARRRMKAADHTAIFCFIVGSYAPLSVLVLGPRARLVFFCSVVAAAATGIVVKLVLLDRRGGPADLLYGAVTWWGLWIAVAAVHVLSPADVALVLGGLVFYSLAAANLGVRWWDPAPETFGYHEVAHSVMLLGTIAHYAVYWRLL